MIKAHRITPESLPRLRAIYERFCAKAKPEFHWSEEPIPFDNFCIAIQHRIMFGYWVEDTAQEEPIAFLLACLEEHRAIEINIIYCESPDQKTVLDRLMRQLIPDIRAMEGWDVVSYAMMGEQAPFIRSILWYGFKPMGQAVLKFDILDSLSLQIMKQQPVAQALTALGSDYRIEAWKPEAAGDVAQSIYEAFHKATDALWDPRFRTLQGARKIVGLLSGSMMGNFIPQCTSLAFKDGVAVGFCFLIQGSPISGNIPLVGVQPSEAGKGLGNILLHRTLDTCVQDVLAGTLNIFSIDTTMDTDNIPAIKMYRRMGFREEHHYPHVYLTREKADAFKPGQWC